eukprot:TRINITY_DN4226_c0_g1_i1.p1 TRINITY_DN4226_c0_g1~~TRINITY_DN4226_c0_g1_i1.p1  ORF type:complete len:339 (-),score=39.23 TRINITY_DN4226_c0_g1_i1:119-1102(-)
MKRIPIIKRWAKGSEDDPKKGKKKKEKSKRPSNSNFKQQRLRACQPILTPLPVIATFLVIGCVFVSLGAVLLVTSNRVIEVEKRYDDVCGKSQTCNVTLHVDDKMDSPILYYKLTNFYQNHRRYVKSRNDAQLRGDKVTSYSDISDCDPVESKGGSSSSKNFYLPCGLIAKSFFNDTFMMRDSSGSLVAWHKEGIAWDSDVDKKFHNPPANAPGIRVIKDFEDEDFIVWMRTAGLPTFKKPYRILDEDLEPGAYTVQINNLFPTHEFDGEKYVVLSTVSWMGGKNPFLGIAYIVVGSICFVLGLLFALRHLIKPRKLGDVKYLNWDR